MLRPELPAVPTVPTTTVAPPPQHSQAPLPSTGRPVVPYVGIGAGAVAAVVVVGIVLTALLAAVAVIRRRRTCGRPSGLLSRGLGAASLLVRRERA